MQSLYAVALFGEKRETDYKNGFLLRLSQVWIAIPFTLFPLRFSYVLMPLNSCHSRTYVHS